jgi:hypothetical protein
MIDLDKFLKFDTSQAGSFEKLDLWLHEQVDASSDTNRISREPVSYGRRCGYHRS